MDSTSEMVDSLPPSSLRPQPLTVSSPFAAGENLPGDFHFGWTSFWDAGQSQIGMAQDATTTLSWRFIPGTSFNGTEVSSQPAGKRRGPRAAGTAGLSAFQACSQVTRPS